MKATYNRTDDVIMLEISSAPIDHAEEVGPFIVHFSPDNKLVLVEILDASEFLGRVAQAEEGKTIEL
ncbi:MAG: DUF2283 domain-containing protein [Candidatus Binatia bacterium]